jgi:hypothetical protein
MYDSLVPKYLPLIFCGTKLTYMLEIAGLTKDMARLEINNTMAAIKSFIPEGKGRKGTKISMDNKIRWIIAPIIIIVFLYFRLSRIIGERTWIIAAKTGIEITYPQKASPAPIYFSKPTKKAPLVKLNIVRAEAPSRITNRRFLSKSFSVVFIRSAGML